MNKKKFKNTKSGNITQKWVELLMPFTENYNAKISASDLGRKAKIPQQTSSRILNNLVKLNLINYTIEGKNKLFYFDLNKQSTKTILNLLELQKSLKFQFNDISLVLNELLIYCESIILFGSYSSNEFNKSSDLDIVILGKSNNDMIKKIKKKSIVKINEHYISYNEFSKLLKLNNPLSIEILKNHILFGNYSMLVNIFLDYYERK